MKFPILTLMMQIAGVAVAAEHVPSIDGLEKDLRACLLEEAKTGNCMKTLLGSRVLPGNDELTGLTAKMDPLRVQWLEADNVYALHSIDRHTAGDLFEQRVYILEDTRGSLLLFEMAFLNRLGKWYVFKLNLDSNADSIRKVLYGED